MADPPAVEALTERIVQRLHAGPLRFYDLLVDFADAEYRDLLLAWGRIRERLPLARDEQGRYLLPSGHQPAGPPAAPPPPAVDGM